MHSLFLSLQTEVWFLPKCEILSNLDLAVGLKLSTFGPFVYLIA